MRTCIRCENFLICKTPDAISRLLCEITPMISGKNSEIHQLLVSEIAKRCKYFERVEDDEEKEL